MSERDQTIKSDEGKGRISLVPPQIVFDIAEVREYGNNKYGSSENWREVEPDRYIDALGRHYLAMLEDPYGKDEESGIEHYKHLACNIAFLCEMLSKDFAAKSFVKLITQPLKPEKDKPENDGWISYHVRLPKEGKKVAGLFRNGDIHTVKMRGFDWIIYGFDPARSPIRTQWPINRGHIQYWKPLPKQDWDGVSCE